MDRIPGEKRLSEQVQISRAASRSGTQPDPAPSAPERGSVGGESEAGLLSPRWAGEPERSAWAEVQKASEQEGLGCNEGADASCKCQNH